MERRKKRQGKSAQLTVFVIIAILIIALLAFVFYRPIKEFFIPPTVSDLIPRTCLEKAVKEGVNLAMLHGGRINPELYFRYNNETLDYLCYTGEWYKTCVMQNPMLKQSIEKEAVAYSKVKLANCLTQMEEDFANKGYELKIEGSKNPTITLEPKKIVVGFDMTAEIQKGEEPKRILDKEMFSSNFNSNAYDIVMIASSIQNFEARYGDSIIDTYMAFYPNIKVEKYKQSDGTKVYIITDRDTKEKLQFATRSLAWPPGYAFA